MSAPRPALRRFDTAGIGRAEYAALPIPGLAGSTCPQGHAMAWCDDRAWCFPIAQ